MSDKPAEVVLKNRNEIRELALAVALCAVLFLTIL